MEVSKEALREIEAAWERYRLEVESSTMTSNSRKTYLLHSKNFVRWLKNEFTPGSTIG